MPTAGIKDESIRWLNDWRPIAVCLVGLGIAWGSINQKQQTIINDQKQILSQLEKFEPYKERLSNIETAFRIRSEPTGKTVIDVRVDALEKTIIKLDRTLERIAAKLDHLIQSENGAGK